MSRVRSNPRFGGLVLALAGLAMAAAHAQRPARDPVPGGRAPARQIFETGLEVAAADPAGQVGTGPREQRVAVRFAELEAAARASARVAIPTGVSSEVVASLTHFDAQAGGFFAAGPLVASTDNPFPDGEATFTVVGDTLVGRIVSGNRLFLVRRAAGSTSHVITEVDQASFPPESQPIEVPESELPRRTPRQFDAMVTAEDVTYVDLLVVYTPAARIEAGSTSAIQAEAVGAVNNANLSLQNAGVSPRYRLVHLAEVAYTESSSTSTDLSNLRNGSGALSGVATLRNQYGADSVTLLRSDTGSCGIGYVMGSNFQTTSYASLMFNVTIWLCANGNLSMAHEIGHNLGLNHDRDNSSSWTSTNTYGAFSYAYGYRISGSRDVMAYACNLPTQQAFNCNTRRSIYSTPLRDFPTTSSPAGVVDSEDNARALNQTMPVAATYFASTVAPQCAFSVSPTEIQVSRAGTTTGSITVTAAAGNVTGCSWSATSQNTSIVTITSGGAGTGNGTVGFSMASNSGAARSVQVLVAEQVVTITQTQGCDIVALSPASATFPRAGGTGRIAVTIESACGWSASSDQSFVTITAHGGIVSGPVDYSVAANSTGVSRSARITVKNQSFTVTQLSASLVPTPSSLRFAAIRNGGGDLTSVTDPQAVTLVYDGASTTSWTASANQPWVQITGGTGSSSGRFTVAIVNPNNVPSSATSVSANITVTATNVDNSPITVPVTLTLQQAAVTTSPPFGQIDTPAQSAADVQGALAVTGWAIDDIGVTGVKVYRNCLAFDIAASCQSLLGQSVVYIGDAAFLPGARPDVETAFSAYPQAYRGGWGMQVLTTMLPHIPSQLTTGGQGAMTLYAFATDEEGNTTLLGRSYTDSTPTSVTVANDTIAKPFGTIDTPGQGGTVSGTVANFGWVLTPDSNTTTDGTDIVMPIDGSTMRVIIDGVVAGTVAYNHCRGTVGTPVPAGVYCNDDIASIFGHATARPAFTTRTSNPTRFRNLDAARGAIGAFTINTATLTNGLHTIAWGVTDSANRAEGIGSRFFTVLNSGGDPPSPDAPAEARGLASSLDALPISLDGVTGRRGFDFSAPNVPIASGADGASRVTIAEMDRLELALGPVTKGYLVANGTLRDLPPGSHLDPATGIFTWVPGPGYVGTYRLVFTSGHQVPEVPGVQTPIDVTIRPPVRGAAGESEIRMHVDGATQLGTTLRVEGWALDPEAFTGSGIGAVHVWARRLDVPTVGPEFFGAAALGVGRPDVAAAFGASYHAAGFSQTSTLAPGLYEITAYVWNQRTARWEDARVRTLRVR